MDLGSRKLLQHFPEACIHQFTLVDEPHCFLINIPENSNLFSALSMDVGDAHAKDTSFRILQGLVNISLPWLVNPDVVQHSWEFKPIFCIIYGCRRCTQDSNSLFKQGNGDVIRELTTHAQNNSFRILQLVYIHHYLQEKDEILIQMQFQTSNKMSVA